MVTLNTNLQELKESVSLNQIGADATFGILSEEKSKQIRDVLTANKDAVQYSAADFLKGTHEIAAIANGVDGPRYTSHQFLIEPLKALSPDSITNQTIGSTAVLANGFVKQAKEKIEKGSTLSQAPDQVNSQQVKDCLNAVGQKCAAIAEQEANQSELAHGSNLQATFGTQTFAANGIRFHSDTSINARSPFTSFNTQDYQVQANNSLSLVSDLQLNQSNQSLNLIQGTQFTQAQTTLSIATDTSDSISRNMRNVGVDSYTSMGKTNTVAADESLVQMSGNSIQTSAYGSVSTQAGGGVSIVSSPGPQSNSEHVHAKGEGEGKDPKSKSGPASKTQDFSVQEILLVSQGQAGDSVMSLSGLGSAISTSGNAVMASGGFSMISAQTGAAVISEILNYFGTPDSSMIMAGGRVFMNTLNGVLSTLQPPQINALPTLPTLPALPEQDLSQCLPKELREGKSGSSKVSQPINPPAFGKPLKPGERLDQELLEKANKEATALEDSPEQQEPPIEVIPQTDTTTFPQQLARALDPSGGSTTSGVNPSKLPGVSAIDKLDKAQNAALNSVSGAAALDTGGLSGGSVNIYLDKLNTKAGLELVKALKNQRQTIQETVSNPELLNYGLTESQRVTAVTPQIITEYLSGIIPRQSLNEFNNPEVLQALLTVKDQLNDRSLSLDNFPQRVSREIAGQALKLFRAYPEAIPQIKNLLQALTALPAIGFLDIIGSIAKGLNIPVLSDLSGLMNLPNLISSGNIGGLVSLASNALGSTGALGGVLNNGGIQGIISAVASGDTNQITSSIGNAVLGEITKKLPPELSGAANSIQSIIMGLEAGGSIDSSQIINQISGSLASITGSQDIAKATEVFTQLQGVIGSAASGNYLDLVFGGGLQPILGNVLGQKNAGMIGEVMGIMEETVGTVQSLALLPELFQTMDEYNVPALQQISTALACTDLFNKIRSLYDRLKGLGDEESNKKAARLLEKGPRLAQLFRTMKRRRRQRTNLGEPFVQDNLDREIEEKVGPGWLEESFDPIELPYYLNRCFTIPRLTLAESAIKVLEINGGQILLEFSNLELLQREIILMPRVGDVVQIQVRNFYDQFGTILTPYQTEFQYTPSTYSFVITELDLQNNQALAIFDNGVGSLILEDPAGVLYEYNPRLMGSQLNLNILDSYLMK